MNPGQDPSDAPNYFSFADDVLYAVNIDNNSDGMAEDVVFMDRQQLLSFAVLSQHRRSLTTVPSAGTSR